MTGGPRSDHAAAAAATAAGAGLSIRDLRFAHRGGPFTLRVPALDVAAGRTAVCFGPSGSGKTTLLHLMAGILLPDAGAVSLGGVPWSSLSESARRLRRISNVGLVFQEFELLEHLTVRENILLPYHVHRALRLDAQAEATAEDLARAAGIHGLLRRKPRALSHGERQRVAICRALVTHPPVLLADEPTGNLDPTTSAAVLDLLLDQARERRATLVMVTHDHSVLGAFDQKIEVSAGPGGATLG